LIIDLAKKIIKRHKELGDDSPLKGINMADFESKTDTAEEKNDLAPELKRQRNNYYVIRNQTLGIYKGRSVKVPGTLLFYITSVRDVLSGIFKTHETELGLWGFDVHASRKGMSGKIMLTGKVTAESGESLSSVLVYLDEIEKSVRTSKSGLYNFRKVEKGIYTVRCIKNLFKTKIVPDVEIKEGECTTLDMVMEDSDSSICISVYYESAVFEGATVKLIETSDEKISDANGNALFEGLKAGKYTAEISAAGKRSETLQMQTERGTYDSFGVVLIAAN
jgi:hypothetical protein